MGTKVYLFGYGGGKSIQDLERQVFGLKAVLIDIRWNPRSSQWQWNDMSLIKRFASRYRWLKQWGNVLYKSAGMQISDMEKGWEICESYLRGDRPMSVVLMCGCSSATACHRTVIAEWLLAEHGIVCEELVVADEPRAERPASAQIALL